jgi:hypothetical protein
LIHVRHDKEKNNCQSLISIINVAKPNALHDALKSLFENEKLRCASADFKCIVGNNDDVIEIPVHKAM